MTLLVTRVFNSFQPVPEMFRERNFRIPRNSSSISSTHGLKTRVTRKRSSPDPEGHGDVVHVGVGGELDHFDSDAFDDEAHFFVECDGRGV